MPTWTAKTASGTTYDFDDTAHTVTRSRADDGAPLRRDGDPVAYQFVSRPALGAPLAMHLDVRRDGRTTERITNLVTELTGAVPHAISSGLPIPDPAPTPAG